MNKSEIVQWAQGPFELIKHADGHFKEPGDTDRRIALIGFDNAIEVCIDVFIKLHPKLRSGVELCREEVENAARNYHTKIEWLEKYVDKNNLQIGFSFEEIVWYHLLRNDLYHSGNGMTPEMHAIEGIRSAAFEVFTTLFKTDIKSLLEGESSEQVRPPDRVHFQAENDEMELLRIFMEFERNLEKSLDAITQKTDKQSRGVKQMWNEYKSLVTTPPEWDLVVQKVLPIRNAITHGKFDKVKTDDIIEASIQLMYVTDALRGSGAKLK